ncbi:hypothetical protein ISP15_13035 [Dyella jejuensis]|uniref:Uncharacterized protein n=1 Tax=Dyella jejuensis TaxID=1432009 RepID=A0ABW8JM39_9GAMM
MSAQTPPCKLRRACVRADPLPARTLFSLGELIANQTHPSSAPAFSHDDGGLDSLCD